MGYQSLSCWPMEFHAFQTLQSIDHDIDYPLEQDGKNLLLKTPDPLAIEHGEIKLVPENYPH